MRSLVPFVLVMGAATLAAAQEPRPPRPPKEPRTFRPYPDGDASRSPRIRSADAVVAVALEQPECPVASRYWR